MIRVVVAEDNLLVRQGVIALLAGAPDIEVVAECGDLESALAAVDDHQPDLLLTDIRMPPDHADEGVRAAVQLRGSRPDVGVLLLSQYDEPSYATRVFADGVAGRGYLLKDHVGAPEQLVTAIREVSAGGSSIDPTIVESMLRAHHVGRDTALARLTTREREVLAQMASGRNNSAIAAQLVLTVRAVERHINSIFAKLGLAEEPDYHRRVRAVLLYLAEA